MLLATPHLHPVVHEVAAGIAAEYFNEVHLRPRAAKAFALVTAGPGLTNIVTALAGAWLEARELLVIGGQVKVSDLAAAQVRQRGIQEIDGVSIAAPVAERSELIDRVLDRAAFAAAHLLRQPRPQRPRLPRNPARHPGRAGRRIRAQHARCHRPNAASHRLQRKSSPIIADRLRNAEASQSCCSAPASTATLPPRCSTTARRRRHSVMLTWNAMDRLGADHPMYFGRPNTWGMRYANILLQQADLSSRSALACRCSRSGFNWQHFIPAEKSSRSTATRPSWTKATRSRSRPLRRRQRRPARPPRRPVGRPRTPGSTSAATSAPRCLWSKPAITPAKASSAPTSSPTNSPTLATADDLVIPCSSGSAFTVMMQTFAQKLGQRIVTNKGLACMGYGLSRRHRRSLRRLGRGAPSWSKATAASPRTCRSSAPSRPTSSTSKSSSSTTTATPPSA